MRIQLVSQLFRSTRNAFNYSHTSRNILSQAYEPDPSLPVVEKPCTIVLAEDTGVYDSSWHDDCVQSWPSKFGATYHQFNFTPSSSFDSSMNELKSDLKKLQPDVVLLARGPWISWMAQLYLEDLPLAGLVMIDPIAMDDQNGVNQYELLMSKKDPNKTSTEYQLFLDYSEHYAHWTLRLEPGAVPMLIAYNKERHAMKRSAERVAQRHGGHMPVLPKLTLNDVNEWIDECVL